MRFLVTAGPTREYLDDVRFLTNASSGRMGYAIARAAARKGHVVHLVAGPVDLPDPGGVHVKRVTTTREMYQAAAAHFARADCVVGAAAPVDFAPARRWAGKKKKSGPLTLDLKPTIDILGRFGARKRRQIIIGFALESQRPIANALQKLRTKNADMIVLNTPRAMGAPKSSATILLKSGDRMEIRNAAKIRIGRLIVSLAEWLHGDAASTDIPRRSRGKEAT